MIVADVRFECPECRNRIDVAVDIGNPRPRGSGNVQCPKCQAPLLVDLTIGSRERGRGWRIDYWS